MGRSKIPRYVDCCFARRDGQGLQLQWLQVTMGPLEVFLLGACTWGVIETSVPWRGLTRHKEHHLSDTADQGDELRPASELPTINSSRGESAK